LTPTAAIDGALGRRLATACLLLLALIVAPHRARAQNAYHYGGATTASTSRHQPFVTPVWVPDEPTLYFGEHDAARYAQGYINDAVAALKNCDRGSFQAAISGLSSLGAQLARDSGRYSDYATPLNSPLGKAIKGSMFGSYEAEDEIKEAEYREKATAADGDSANVSQAIAWLMAKQNWAKCQPPPAMTNGPPIGGGGGANGGGTSGGGTGGGAADSGPPPPSADAAVQYMTALDGGALVPAPGPDLPCPSADDAAQLKSLYGVWSRSFASATADARDYFNAKNALAAADARLNAANAALQAADNMPAKDADRGQAIQLATERQAAAAHAYNQAKNAVEPASTKLESEVSALRAAQGAYSAARAKIAAKPCPPLSTGMIELPGASSSVLDQSVQTETVMAPPTANVPVIKLPNTKAETPSDK
jgi:hypothetical protein